MRITIHTFKLVILLPLAMLLSCDAEDPLSKVASIDVLITKQTTVHYLPGKRPFTLAFPTPDSVFFRNTALYREHIDQSMYEYDDQKRIVKIHSIDLEHPDDSYRASPLITTYKYDVQTVALTSNRYPLAIKALNSEGYVADGNTYDQNGYRIASGGTKTVIVNDNVIQTTATSPDIGLTVQTIYEYDLTKPNLPDPFKNLYGKPSHNLPVKETQQSTWTNGQTNKTVTTYTYEYDQRGLPKRSTISVEDGSPTEWNTKSTSKYVRITDFEFTQ